MDVPNRAAEGMAIKRFLIAMTAVAVVSDSMLVPFYPQFFAEAFRVTDPRHVGFYVGACCFVVMLAFPFWAAVARKIRAVKPMCAPTLPLLVYTQLAAGVFSILCYRSDALLTFWLVSLLMLVFKGSYLLIYPYLMELEDKDRHADIIGLLSVIVHFGAILGALLGGLVLESFEPRQIFLVMAAGDFIQTLACLLLIKYGRAPSRSAPEQPRTEDLPNAALLPRGFVYKLGLVMLLYYFSAFLTRPFFSRYWESLSAFDSKTVSGLVFAIPGVVALFALRYNRRRGARQPGSAYQGIVPAMVLGICGLLLQASQLEALVLAGRVLFGWGVFHATVRLDLLLFEISTPASYATDFSKISFFQNLGALVASFTAGAVVPYGLFIPFVVAAGGFAFTALLYRHLFRAELQPAAPLATAS